MKKITQYRILEKPSGSGRFIIQEKKQYFSQAGDWYARSKDGGPTTEYGSLEAATKRMEILERMIP